MIKPCRPCCTIAAILCLLFFFSRAPAEDRVPRYISLAPSTTEILFALGLDKEIVGISTFCNHPAETEKKARVGDFSHPNIEKIISLKPDYIFCTGLEQAPAVSQLKRFKLNVFVCDPVTIDELMASISEMGIITGRVAEAQRLTARMKTDIEEVRSRVRLIPPEKKVKVFVEIWHQPLMTAGKGSLVDELVLLAGGINISHDIERPYSNFSAEKVVSLDPDCIIMTYMDKEPPLRMLESRFGWDTVKAVKSGRVYNDINPDILLRPGPRTTEGLKELFKRFYPHESGKTEAQGT